MPLTLLKVRDFRIIEAADLQFSSRINLVTGANGSGKTSLLEAIHFLATGRSFLAGRTANLVRRETQGLSVFGSAHQKSVVGEVRLGMALDRSGFRRCRVDGENQRSVVRSALALPLFVIEPNTQLLVAGGPAERRRFMDRGLFHVEHRYQDTWSRYRRAMEQRNALLRSNASDAALKPWELSMVETAEHLHGWRQGYLQRIESLVREKGSLFPGVDQLTLRYYPGWETGKALHEVLVGARDRDRRQGYTGRGPHRADFGIRLGDSEVKGVASRGQVKRLCVLLVLSQLIDFHREMDRDAVLMVDDFGSELDADSQSLLLEVIALTDSQVIANTLDPERVRQYLGPTDRMFHVEHGRFEAVL